MPTPSIIQVRIKKASDGKMLDLDDHLAIEEPLEILLQYFLEGKYKIKNISVTMRTPGSDNELAVGFLFTEGIIQSRNQLQEVRESDSNGNRVQIILDKSATPLLRNSERNFYTTSSCGVCGKESIEAIKTISVYPDCLDEISLNTKLFYTLQDQLKKQQVIFESTGGLHASALFDLDGNFEMLREDVGRHNALDKLIGAALLNDQLPLSSKILLLSGRVSFELVQKAMMAGIKVIAGVGAPSSLAVQLAIERGITLIGFLSIDRFNIYSAKERIAV